MEITTERLLWAGVLTRKKHLETYSGDGMFSIRVWQNFSVREWRVIIFGFKGHTVSASTQFYQYGMKLDTDKTQTNGCGCFNFIYRQ